MGPYPGTFTESISGNFSHDGLGNDAGPSFTANFTIQSPTGTVAGTKNIADPDQPFPAVSCDTQIFSFFSQLASYQATITTSTGSYSDHGRAVNESAANGRLFYFVDGYASNLFATVLISPTSKEQCKNGGYQAFPQFRNQGDCVSFVATGGKNTATS